MPLELGRSGKRPGPDADARAARLYSLIAAEVRTLSLADRLRMVGAFKRGASWADLDPAVQDAFRSVSQQL